MRLPRTLPRRRLDAAAALIAALLLLAVLAGCSRPGGAESGGGTAAAPRPGGSAPAPTSATAPTSTAAAAGVSTTAATAAPAQPSTTAALPARFQATVSPLPAALAARMRGTTWQPGCPVPLGRLRLLSLRYWGFDGRVHQGPMVVNQTVSGQVVAVFRRLFQARFPVQELHLAVRYVPGQDDPNDTRNYTDAFNCRPVVTARGPLRSWSQHAYGLAIDINPIQNPYVASDGYVRNNHARPYRDRSLERPGMIHPGDAVVRAFAAVGWEWGGSWRGAKDYMHFSLTGR